MRKSDKKIDNQLCKALTEVCESSLENIAGFKWLTHLVNYQRFPESLHIVLVFQTDADIERFKQNDREVMHLQQLIKMAVASIGIELKRIEKHLSYDSEQQCELHQQGDWAARFSRRH